MVSCDTRDTYKAFDLWLLAELEMAAIPSK